MAGGAFYEDKKPRGARSKYKKVLENGANLLEMG